MRRWFGKPRSASEASRQAEATLAMNLLDVRRWPSAVEALLGEAREVDYEEVLCSFRFL